MNTIARFLLAVEFLCVVIAIIAAIDRNPLAAGAAGFVGLTSLAIHAGWLVRRLDGFQSGKIMLNEDAQPGHSTEPKNLE